MLFNVPPIASQAGAASPLVFIISGIGLLLLGVAIVYLSRRLTSAGGFYTWVRHSLGKRTAFQAGWWKLWIWHRKWQDDCPGRWNLTLHLVGHHWNDCFHRGIDCSPNALTHLDTAFSPP